MIVIHEIFGLTDHIRDVTRRVAKAGYLALAPDLASRAGGSKTATNIPGVLTSGSVDDRVADLKASAAYLEQQPDYNGKLGAVGFCFGGGMTLSFAAAEPKLRGRGAVLRPDAGPGVGDEPRRRPRSSLTTARTTRASMPASPRSRPRSRARRSRSTSTRVPDTRFNNDTGDAYNEAAAVEAWGRTLAWFKRYLSPR